MNYLFIIQGEGRGHMTQAISLAAALESHGHNIKQVWMGKSPQRKVPGFITEYFNGKMSFFRSPNFIRTYDKKGIHILYSFLYNTILLPGYLFEIIRLAIIFRKRGTDRIVNFYDAIGGMAYRISFSGKPYFVISHQYYFGHPDFIPPLKKPLQWSLLRLYSFLCALGADKKIALSFAESRNLEHRKLYVVPPLLREEIYSMKSGSNGYILVYLLNPGILAEIKSWCTSNPNKEVVAFSDSISRSESPVSNLRLEPLSGESFLLALASCESVVCTAGFETVAEAAYLGKRILVIPTQNHFEQKCNAADAERVGIASQANGFKPELISQEFNGDFYKTLKNWFDQNPEMIVKLLEY